MKIKWNSILLKKRSYTLINTVYLEDTNIEYSTNIKVSKTKNETIENVKKNISVLSEDISNSEKFKKIKNSLLNKALDIKSTRKYTTIASFTNEDLEKSKNCLIPSLPRNGRKYTKLSSVSQEEQRRYTLIATIPFEKVEKEIQKQKVINYENDNKKVASM